MQKNSRNLEQLLKDAYSKTTTYAAYALVEKDKGAFAGLQDKGWVNVFLYANENAALLQLEGPKDSRKVVRVQVVVDERGIEL